MCLQSHNPSSREAEARIEVILVSAIAASPAGRTKHEAETTFRHSREHHFHLFLKARRGVWKWPMLCKEILMLQAFAGHLLVL